MKNSMCDHSRIGGFVLAIFGGLLASELKLFAQGCMPAGFMAPNLAAKGLRILQGGEWEASIHYRFLETENGYIGDDVWEAGKEIVARNWIHSIDLEATYAFTPRYSLSLTVPFFHAERSTVLDHDGDRHSTTAAGLRDLRLVAHGWLFEPKEHTSGNVLLGLGVKLPTGEDEATDTFLKPTGPEIR